jgi:aspartyl protease family protein
MSGSVLKSALGVAVVAFIAAQALSDIATSKLGDKDRAPAPIDAAQPVRPALPAAASSAFAAEARIAADRLGQYSANVEIDGARLRMLVDTGASVVVLSYEDAAAAGLYPAPSDFKFPVQTANGVARMARVRLREVRLGNLALRDVDAYVGERGALSASLLGMSFLSRLSRIEAGAGTLVLRQ